MKTDGRFVVVRKTGRTPTHAVFASGGPEDGSLAGFSTLCGLPIGLEIKDISAWTELPTATEFTCANCARVVEAENA